MRKLTRGHFLKFCGSLFSFTRNANFSSGDHADVLVIGAGIAGLHAANLLQTKLKVIVLEARDRVGGRICTNHSFQVPLDLGASWIHGHENNPITYLAKLQKVPLLPTDYSSVVTYNAVGNPLSEAQETNMEKDYYRVLSALEDLRRKYQIQKEKDISLRQAIAIVTDTQHLSDTLLLHSFSTYIEQEYAASLDELSLYYWDRDERFPGQDFLFPTGYEKILPKLTKGVDIRLSTKVQKISYDRAGVEVMTDRGSFRASYALITVPLGVLKAGSIQFAPSLPQNKLQAIRNLGMGNLHKLYLQFPQVFWEKDPHFIHYIGDHQGQFSSIFNLFSYIQEPILLFFNAGAYSDLLERKGETYQVQAALRVLQKVYGDIPTPIKVLSSRWRQDQFAYGAYSFMQVGATEKDIDRLAADVAERLFFAGEATAQKYPATVHGAYLSGEREAYKILSLV